MSANNENDLVPLTLRIPRNVHGKLKDLSEAEYRSLNHQIIMALSYFLDVHEKFGGLPSPDYLRKAAPSGAFHSWMKTPAASVPSKSAR